MAWRLSTCRIEGLGRLCAILVHLWVIFAPPDVLQFGLKVYVLYLKKYRIFQGTPSPTSLCDLTFLLCKHGLNKKPAFFWLKRQDWLMVPHMALNLLAAMKAACAQVTFVLCKIIYSVLCVLYLQAISSL